MAANAIMGTRTTQPGPPSPSICTLNHVRLRCCLSSSLYEPRNAGGRDDRRAQGRHLVGRHHRHSDGPRPPALRQPPPGSRMAPYLDTPGLTWLPLPP
jgi:hypothetical protein